MKVFPIILQDHLGGFDKNLFNIHLYKFNKYAKYKGIQGEVTTTFFIDKKIKDQYSNLVLKYSAPMYVWKTLTNYHIHPEINYKNFICSFNGSNHVGRQLLSSILNNQGYFNPKYSSKNFSYDNDWISGHLSNLNLTREEIQLYSKFFINNEKFNNSVYSFGHIRFAHHKNIYKLENKLTQSFLHIVSETMATSYYPFVTEKFLYSIVTRGLFLAYAQPEWHKHIEKYHGFRLYNKIFDYDFDTLHNPVKRLIRLIETVSKFSTLSVDDWKDLYLLEQDTIEYNYDHYFSGNYLEWLKQHEH